MAPVAWPGRGGPIRPRPVAQKVPTLSSFTTAAAASQDGPAWLQAHRAAAAARFAAGELPSPAEEVWRYSRIADLDLDRWHPVTGAAAPTAAPASTLVPDAAVVVTVVDGAAVVSALPDAWAERGVTIAVATELATAAASGLGSVAGEGPDAFAALADAFATAPIVVDVPRGVELAEPILVATHLAEADGASFPRLVVRLGDGAAATVVEHVTSGPDPVLSIPFTELAVGNGARLAYLHVQDLGPAAWQIGSLVATVGQEGDLRAGLVGLGGAAARLRTDCRLEGRGANGDLYAAYFGEADQHLDFRTFQHHLARDTTSNLLFKGAVGGRSRSVYTGLIRVDKEARGTNAFQTNRNIKLSDDAWAESVPNLEIETNDVRCSHASTVGPVDEEQRFYLESRGVPPTVADRLIVGGFFDEVVRQLPAPSAVPAVRALVTAKLDRTEGDLR